VRPKCSNDAGFGDPVCCTPSWTARQDASWIGRAGGQRRGQNGGSSVQSGTERIPGGGVGLAAAVLATWRGATVLSTGKLVVRVRH
jgi:hypothetical protein